MKDTNFDIHLKQKNMCPKMYVKNYLKNYVKLFHKVIFRICPYLKYPKVNFLLKNVR